MHVLMLLGMIVWFGLVGLRWYLRPGDLMQLAGSLVLGMVYFSGFLWYVTRPR